MNTIKQSAPPKLLVLEGLDGSGTTTQVGLLAQWLRGFELPVETTSQPSGGPIGSLIRQILSGRLVVRDGEDHRQPGNGQIALLFAADRLDHVESQIQPALEAGRWVLCDRYYCSSFAYQALQEDLSWVMEINSRAPSPDLTLFLDVPPVRCMERTSSRLRTDIYETLEQQSRIEHSYHTAMERLRAAGEKIVVVDGDRPEDEVQQDLRRVIEPMLGC